MFFIPGVIISVVTFPGVIVHEIAHQLFCRLFKIPVYKVCYFRVANPCGYVIHESIKSPFKNLVISIGPFLINTIVGALLTLPASVRVLEFGDYTNPFNLIVLWLGISVLMHAFPSTGDAKSLVESVMKSKEVNIFVKILVAPFVGLIYLGAVGSIFWLDLGYAVAISFLLPKLLLYIV